MKNFLISICLPVAAFSLMFTSLFVNNSYALKYGRSSYNSYSSYYNTHRLPPSKFFKHRIIKIVYQLDSASPKKWGRVIHHITNSMAPFEYNPMKYHIELVLYGGGIKMGMKKFDKKFKSTLQSLVTYGLKIRACHNTMVGMHITIPMLFPFVKVVPAGVLEIARKEMQGYAYEVGP